MTREEQQRLTDLCRRTMDEQGGMETALAYIRLRAFLRMTAIQRAHLLYMTELEINDALDELILKDTTP